MKIFNDMNCVNDKELNNIVEWNLLHDILNPSKSTIKYPLFHYSKLMYEYT